ncbi:MAG: histidine--tRNA ligase [Eudoraea sp.]|nr:histidine--tRNA ligase [Eudoraea sp.]
MPQKPAIPKGTRDFSPREVARRNYIIETIRRYFKTYGFLPIETPAMENMDTLMGKYGEEGDRLIFKILNSGDFINKVDDVTYSSKNSKSLTPKISEKALRYDLTVPFARYVVMHQNEIDFPFKRYQIQPVWRADRPQKGRFREFYQCDADVVGPKSMWQEVEFVQLYGAVFKELNLEGVQLKLNNRKVLSGIAEVIGAKNHLISFTVALDKLDKIGREAVIMEMQEKGITPEAIEKARPLFSLTGNPAEKLNKLKDFLSESEIGMQGVEELNFIMNSLEILDTTGLTVQIDVTLARGLNYYTGTIMEVAAPEGVKMGSIGGGGRYDDLTGIFGLKGVSGVGISFGLDRIYLVLEELGLFPKEIDQTLDVLCINFGREEAMQSFKLIKKLRDKGVKADLYPQKAKMQKQMKYANNRQVPYVVLIGEEELNQGVFVVKDMVKGTQKTYQLQDPDSFLSEL